MLRQRCRIEWPRVGNYFLQFQEILLPQFASPELAEGTHPKKRKPHFLLEVRLERRRDPDRPISCRVHQFGNTGEIWKIEQLKKTIDIPACRRFVGFSVGDAPLKPRIVLVQLPGYPIHLRTVGGRFLRNHDIAALRQQAPKAIEHSFRAPDHLTTDCRVCLIEPSGQTDPSGDGINLGDGVTRLGQDQIGSDDKRHIIAELFLARKFDQFGGLPSIQICGDPRGLFAFDATLVKLVTRALENEKPMTELFEFFFECAINRKRIGRKEKILLGEQALFGEGSPDRSDFVEVGVHWQER